MQIHKGMKYHSSFCQLQELPSYWDGECKLQQEPGLYKIQREVWFSGCVLWGAGQGLRVENNKIQVLHGY